MTKERSQIHREKTDHRADSRPGGMTDSSSKARRHDPLDTGVSSDCSPCRCLRLIYQVVWGRLAVLVFGSTTMPLHSSRVFFLGLAWELLAGIRGPVPSPLVLYGC